MIINEIIDDIKKTYSVEISRWRAVKGKQIAMNIVKRDGRSNIACCMTMLQSWK